MTFTVDFQPFYREMFSGHNLTIEEVNDEQTYAYVVDHNGETFHIETISDHIDSFNNKFSVSSYMIRSWDDEGDHVGYDVCLKLSTEEVFSCSALFYANSQAVNLSFKHLGKSGFKSIAPAEMALHRNMFGEMAVYMINHLLTNDPKCRLYFATGTIRVNSVWKLPIPTYM